MRNAVTISLPAEMAAKLDQVAKSLGQTRSQFVQDSVRKSLFREQIEAARKSGVPAARRIGWYTDEDIFKAVS
jgi:predicted transcriptional regulator